jgi:hypothetical protein
MFLLFKFNSDILSFVPFVLLHFCHSASPVFYLVSDDSIFDFDSEIKCENENEIWVISTNLVCFDL